ncbi:MAG: excinuclease ABC subunit UvrA [Chitinophagaceae bacterium]|nr:excinuclease ABC subunit UvrA [Chitinophagaceae bacterium]
MNIQSDSLVLDIQDDTQSIDIYGAREHNLKDINISIKKNQLIVMTGVSGSGKSSLAFDTIYAEGQRRYMESFSSYVRGFIGHMERPDVDKINGLSPVISIEQKTISRNPRSTVGTVTEIYDFLRLLYARASDACTPTGKNLVKQTEEQIITQIHKQFLGTQIKLFAPAVKGRKGTYKDLFQQMFKLGFSTAQIDGVMKDISPRMELDRYKIHNIEILIDTLDITEHDVENDNRIKESIKTALKYGEGVLLIQDDKKNFTYFSKMLMDPETGISYEEPSPNTFSYNSQKGYCPECKGMGIKETYPLEVIIPDDKLSIKKGGIAPLGIYRNATIFSNIEEFLEVNYNLTLDVPLKKFPPETLKELLHGNQSQYMEYIEAMTTITLSTKKPITKRMYYFEGLFHFFASKQKNILEQYVTEIVCSKCNGTKLKPESLYFKIDKKNIAELSDMNIYILNEWLTDIETRLSEKQNIISKEILKEIRKRISFLIDIGLDYLSLSRPIKTLSGGEAQRIRLANQIGTQLVDVLYILDEPSIGLHQRDNAKLIKSLKNLRDLGNTVIVVEHDKEIMMDSDYIIDIGPGAGVHGGKIVAQGTPSEIIKMSSVTSEFLAGKLKIETPPQRRTGNEQYISIEGAKGNNLQSVNLNIPLGKMICITGVSGSGKSTLIHNTLFPILKNYLSGTKSFTMPYASVTGIEHIDKVIEVDQSPIGRTPRSNPATYTGLFTHIRNLFTELPESKIRGYKPGRFSFNLKGGRCENCEGGGIQIIEMEFLPDVHVTCEVCKGKRYNRETLEARYKGKSIYDVLEMKVEQAVQFFEHQPLLLRYVKVLQDVGLSYLTLGQSSTTLSGGEAQRIKLASELYKRDTSKTLYILDEPTTGLHFQDIKLLLNVLHKLVDKGNTVLIIEHNLDVIKVCDHIIDLGPDSGNKGGRIVAEGTPEEISQNQESITGAFLKKELESNYDHIHYNQ